MSRIHLVAVGQEEVGSPEVTEWSVFPGHRTTCFGRRLSSTTRPTTCGLWLSSWPSTELPPSGQAWFLRHSVSAPSTSLSRISPTTMRWCWPTARKPPPGHAGEREENCGQSGHLGQVGNRNAWIRDGAFFPISGFRWSSWGARMGWVIQFLMELQILAGYKLPFCVEMMFLLCIKKYVAPEGSSKIVG